MEKLGIFFTVIFVATILAGAYGALHDQITYTISSEYFRVYKFEQFGFLEWGHYSPRLTTALIGFLATWWVGLYIGIVQSLVGLIHRSHKAMFKHTMNNIFIALGVAVIFAIVGAVVGYIQTKGGDFDCCFPYQIIERRNFRIVGTIHRFGYTGGEVGAAFGIAYQVWMRKTRA